MKFCETIWCFCNIVIIFIIIVLVVIVISIVTLILSTWKKISIENRRFFKINFNFDFFIWRCFFSSFKFCVLIVFLSFSFFIYFGPWFFYFFFSTKIYINRDRFLLKLANSLTNFLYMSFFSANSFFFFLV